MNLSPLQAEARLKTDIKASKTIAITIAAYFACYVPSVVYAIVAVPKETLTESWFAFFAYYSLYLSSAANPIIYYVRSSRFRSAFRQFLKDPLGSSDIREKPSGQNNGEVRKIDVMASKRNGKDALGAEADGKKTRQKISKDQENGIMILSFKTLQAPQAWDHEVKGAIEKTPEVLSSKAQSPYPGTGEQTSAGNEEVCKEHGLKSDSKKPKRRLLRSSTKNVHPLEITDLDKLNSIEAPRCRVQELK